MLIKIDPVQPQSNRHYYTLPLNEFTDTDLIVQRNIHGIRVSRRRLGTGIASRFRSFRLREVKRADKN